MCEFSDFSAPLSTQGNTLSVRDYHSAWTAELVLPRAGPGQAGGIFCLAWPWPGLTFLSEVGPWPGLQLAGLAGSNQATREKGLATGRT